ncbi:hypothetical protein DFH08DRAFT_969022 [Mycena albidolilacea]|uniref:Uncharacterized protein n=1 Tax=Mycena albidolilacea TaxID=1033008 RepID=A0AAD6ZIR9_9AGAR|nr:hypothetical protein DFH08DRAFT_969022 [Mycena albidolilacea]
MRHSLAPVALHPTLAAMCPDTLALPSALVYYMVGFAFPSLILFVSLEASLSRHPFRPLSLSMPAFMITHLFLALLHRPSLPHSLSLILILLLPRLRPFPPPLLPCTPSGSSFELGGTVPHPFLLPSVLLSCYRRLHPPSSVSSYAVPLAVSFPRPSFVPFRRVAPNPLPPSAPSPLLCLPFWILPVIIARTLRPFNAKEKLRELDDNSFSAACLAAAAKGTAAFPSACAECAAQFGVTDPGASTTAAGVAIS